MTTLASRTSIADKPHRVLLQNPGAPVPDGKGGFTQSWTDLLPPTMQTKIAPATAADLERVASGTVISTATHIVTMSYHPQVATKTRLIFDGRTFHVTGVANPEERKVDTILICKEVVG